LLLPHKFAAAIGIVGTFNPHVDGLMKPDFEGISRFHGDKHAANAKSSCSHAQSALPIKKCEFADVILKLQHLFLVQVAQRF
jgi:hypothetical protein